MKFCCGRRSKPTTILRLDERLNRPDTNPDLGNAKPATAEQDAVDYLIRENKERNKTTMYDQDELIVRRCCQFDINAGFNRALNSEGDTIRLELINGVKKPSLKTGTMVRLTLDLDSRLKENSWCMVGTISETDAKMTINIPPAACLGKYTVRLYLRTKTAGDEIESSFKELDPIYVVANPFSVRDSCWSPESNPGLISKSTEFLDEYVLNEVGGVWRGVVSRPNLHKWTFGQFDKDILDIVCHLLVDDSRTKTAAGAAKLSSLVEVARILAAQVNSNDGGVLAGNWSGDYTGGSNPLIWSSSITILKQYKENNYAPVNYGQCWVFSAVLVTCLRALGIPARSITNYYSAHDTNNTMTIDRYMKDGDEIHISGDSVWNFHVWNEVYLNRWDLPSGYDGWQALDATPQELSDGQFQCGPCPVNAIKQGQTFLKYDAGFVYAEVNADACTWVVDDDDKITGLSFRSRGHVGRSISTLSPGQGNFERLDVTNEYKAAEGSEEEMQNFERAFRFAGWTMMEHRKMMEKYLFNFESIPIKIEVVPRDDVEYGKTIIVEIILTNIGVTDIEPRSIRVVSNSINQQGVAHKFIMQHEPRIKNINGGESVVFPFEITAEEYIEKLAPDGHGFIQIDAMVKIESSGKVNTLSGFGIFAVDIPADDILSIQMSHRSCNAYDDDISATVMVKNKLDHRLTNLRIEIDGRNLMESIVVDRENNPKLVQAKPDQSFEMVVKLFPKKTGIFTVTANLYTDELVDIRSSANLEVLE